MSIEPYVGKNGMLVVVVFPVSVLDSVVVRVVDVPVVVEVGVVVSVVDVVLVEVVPVEVPVDVVVVAVELVDVEVVVVGGAQGVTSMKLDSMVTAPLRARARPWMVTKCVRVIPSTP